MQQGHRIVRNIKYEKLRFVLLTFNQRLSHIVHVLCDALVNLQTLTMIFFLSLCFSLISAIWRLNFPESADQKHRRSEGSET